MHEKRALFQSNSDLRASARSLATGSLRIDGSFNLSDVGLMTPRAINLAFPKLEAGDVIVVHGDTGNQKRHLTHFSANADPTTIVAHLADIYLTAAEADNAPAPNTEVFRVPADRNNLIERVPYSEDVHFNLCTHSEYNGMFNPRIPERRRSEANRLRQVLGLLPPILGEAVIELHTARA
jgi:hypothetical protein